jgi:hypothetical protein
MDALSTHNISIIIQCVGRRIHTMEWFYRAYMYIHAVYAGFFNVHKSNLRGICTSLHIRSLSVGRVPEIQTEEVVMSSRLMTKIVSYYLLLRGVTVTKVNTYPFQRISVSSRK